MLGAIIGDIVGSRFEFNNHKNKIFELFTRDCRPTDDSIMTLAVAKAIMETNREFEPDLDGLDDDFFAGLRESVVRNMRELGQKYPDCGFGGMFAKWVISDAPKPYNSYGNGAAMRVSPAGFAAGSRDEAMNLAEAVTDVTHDHPEGIKGAEAVAIAIFMARRGYFKHEIRAQMLRYYPSLVFTCDGIRDTYSFNETCQETVPQAIVAFLEAESFEDAIRTAVSLGGDSDTLAAIAGSIAEAYFGIPDAIKAKALSLLDEELRLIYYDWTAFAGDFSADHRFGVLTKFIPKIYESTEYDRFVRENGEGMPWRDRTNERRLAKSLYDLTDIFVREFLAFSDTRPEYELQDFVSILGENDILWEDASMTNADVAEMDERCALALIMAVIRMDEDEPGAIARFIGYGSFQNWLDRLMIIDTQRGRPEPKEILLSFRRYASMPENHWLSFFDGVAQRETERFMEDSLIRDFSSDEARALLRAIGDVRPEYWDDDYENPSVLDGQSWSLRIRFGDRPPVTWSGTNAYPPRFSELLKIFGINGNG
ncbi:MAG: ADP-ribosylglycohydrolase family protein [Oscillospiraceae bacterium]|nr:ADP-ribosylglycohydrolase family protein [Oscillospiraceae bacterium]